MSQEIINTSVTILEKEYHIKCPASEVPSLQQAAVYLQEKLQERLKYTTALNAESVMMVTALNIAHQLLNMEQQKAQYQQALHQRIQDLHHKVESVLAPQLPLELSSETE